MKLALLIISAALLLDVAIYQPPPSKAPQKALMSGPILYAIRPNGTLYKIDVMNCTICRIATLSNISGFGNNDLLVLPNGDLLVQYLGGLARYTLPNPDPIWTDLSQEYLGSIIGTNGIVYVSTTAPAGLASYDPATNSTTFIGAWPTNMIINEFFYQNGVLYGFGSLSGPQIVVAINLIDPGQSTVVYSQMPINQSGGVTNDGYNSMLTLQNDKKIYKYNISTNAFELVCDFSAFLPSFGINGLTDLPPGVPEAPCLCSTSAGTVNNQTINVCVPVSVTVPYNNNAVLDANDILRYILFSNNNDTLGSILVQSNSANIAFNPATMQTGVTYYLASIAGDNLNGNVDLNDSCLNISNIAARVIWREKPAVTFTVANPNVCAGGCTTVTATFTGAPPFTLSYTTPGNGTQTQTFSGNTGTFQVCVPANAAPGSFQLTATSLVDAWCSCN